MRLGCDRLVGLGGLLASRSLRYKVVKTGKARHVLLRAGKGRARLLLVAHYDRAPNSPGALDNSCACIQLIDFAHRVEAAGGPPFLFAFTDEEEAPGSGEASAQGSFSLARALVSGRTSARAPGSVKAAPELGALVLDVTGRGGQLLLSSAPAELLARNGLALSAAAEGHRALADLARRACSRTAMSPPLGASLPWSDDLGFTLGGLPALTLSLLPAEELPCLDAGRKPPTWELLHSAEDRPEKAEEGAFFIMAAFLDALCAELAARS